jgi:response regulator RpfG family c-di-GMP phosphodiesterase/nitrate/nitrite-specific signal transduction histidine kinase
MVLQEPFSSLRSWIAAIAALAFLPGTTLFLLATADQQRQLIRHAHREVQVLTEHSAGEVLNVLYATRQLLADLAAEPQVVRAPAGQCSTLLARRLAASAAYANLGVTALDGSVRCLARSGDGRATVDAEAIRRAVAHHGLAVGRYQAPQAGSPPVITVAYPLPVASLQMGRRTDRAAVFALVDLWWLNKLAAGVPLPPGSVLTLLDRQHAVLARSQEPETWMGRQVSDPGVLQAVAQGRPQVTVQGEDQGGRSVFVGHRALRGPTGGTELVVAVTVPRDALLAELRRHRVRSAFGLLAAAFLTLTAAWRTARRVLVVPVERIAGVTRRLAAGDLDARTGGVAGPRELTVLAQAVDEMAGALQRRAAEVEQAAEAAHAAAEQAQALAHTAQRLNAQLDLPTVLRAVVEETARALRAPAASIALYDEVTDRIAIAATYGLPHDYAARAAPQPRAVFDRLVAESHQDLLLVPEALNRRDLPNTALHREAGVRTIVGAPLRRDGHLVGLLAVYALGVPRHFHLEELALLRALGDLAVQAIVNATLHTDHVRQLETLSALYASAQKLGISLDLQEVARSITRTCVEVFGARLAWIGRAEPDGSVRLVTSYPISNDYPTRLRVRWDESPEGQGPTGQALRTGFPQVFNDVAQEPPERTWRDRVLAQGFRAAAAFPLLSRERPFGVLLLYSDQAGFFTDERVGLFQALAHQAGAALENARLFAQAEQRLQHLQALHAVGLAIGSSVDLDVTLDVVLSQAVAQLRVDAAAILLYHPERQVLEYAARRGLRPDHSVAPIGLGEGLAGTVAANHRAVFIDDLGHPDAPVHPIAAVEGLVGYAAVPLVAKGVVQGVLEVFRRTPLVTDQEWRALLEALGDQAAIAIDNARLFDALQRAHRDLQGAYEATLEGWVQALDLRDQETHGHTQRVTEMTVRLARAMGIDEPQLVHIRRGALLHDIGKIGIPDTILRKPGPLTEEEWAVVRRHPLYAHQLLFPIPYLRPALDIPYAHHERWDGSGYPQGLRGEAIPLAARIFAVVDVWDALRSDRPYRPAWPDDRVIAYLREQSGKAFDPRVVEVFLRLLEQPGPRSLPTGGGDGGGHTTGGTGSGALPAPSPAGAGGRVSAEGSAAGQCSRTDQIQAPKSRFTVMGTTAVRASRTPSSHPSRMYPARAMAHTAKTQASVRSPSRRQAVASAATPTTTRLVPQAERKTGWGTYRGRTARASGEERSRRTPALIV